MAVDAASVLADDVGRFAALIARARAALRPGGHVADGLDAAEQACALVAADEFEPRALAGLLRLQLLQRQGSMHQVIDLGVELLPLLRERASAADPSPDRPRELFMALTMVSVAASECARWPTALETAQEAHQVALGIDEPALHARAVSVLACVFERIGDPWRAESLLLEALTLARASGSAAAVLGVLNNLCATLIGAYLLMRDALPPAQADAPLRRALPLAREALRMLLPEHEPILQTSVIGNVGEILAYLGESDEAEALLVQARDLALTRGFALQVGRILCSIGELHLLRERPETALQVMQDALDRPQGRSVHNVELRLHHGLWRACRALGRSEQALRHLEQHLSLERVRSLSQLRGQSELFLTRHEAERVQREAAQYRRRAAVAEHDARVDPLTGLGNRRDLMLRWRDALSGLQERSRLDRRAPWLCVAIVDVDHFKQANDRFGHEAGDAVLVGLARLLRENTRDGDLLARMGGEEFVIVLPEAPLRRALEITERLRQRVAAHDWSAIAPGLAVTISIGLAASPPLELEPLLRRADSALYQAKRDGRNCVVAG